MCEDALSLLVVLSCLLVLTPQNGCSFNDVFRLVYG